MSSRKATPQKEPTIPLDRALGALKDQLEALQKLKGRRYDEAQSDKREWQHTTEGIIEAGFGNPSTALDKFHMANTAGIHNIMGIGPHQRQVNFETQINEHEVLLRSLIRTLQLQLPEEEIKGIYEPGDEYAFYRDLSSLVQVAAQDVFCRYVPR